MPLRILHVTPYYEQAWAYGGIPRIVTTLATAQVSLGHSVTVCTTDAGDATTRAEPGAAPADGPAGPAVRMFRNASNRLAHDLQCFLPLGLRSFLADHSREFDVAHVHACRHLPGSIATRALKKAAVPYVLAPNGTAPRIERRFLAKRVYDRLLGARDLAGATRIIAVSDHERRQLVEEGIDEGRLCVIPNPICLDEHEPPVARKCLRDRTHAGGVPIVLYLGRLSPRKRLDVLIRAIARSRRGARLVVAGSDMGAEGPARRLAGELGLMNRVEFRGVLTGRDRLEALAEASIVAYPSQDEIFGLVPLEALLCGTPVVVADDSGCGAIVDALEGGRVVPLGDAAALAAALDHVLDEPERWDRLVNRAASLVRVRYGPVGVAARVVALYEELLER